MEETVTVNTQKTAAAPEKTGEGDIAKEDFARGQKIIRELSDYYDTKMVGQQNLKFVLTTAMMANGHILLESVPGLAKTTAAKTIADAVSAKFSRIQCTPDLLPGDIIGTQIYNQATREFETILGPVFANFVLLDEVNRSSAKTQSAMLEAMQERQVTIGGKTHKMPEDIFMVIATQNPIEQEGTYPLSEAQTDRFMLKETITYPSASDEVEILNRIENGAMNRKTKAPLTIEDVDFLQELAGRVYVDLSIKRYIANIVDATRNTGKILSSDMAKYVRMGASPRASIAFMRVAKAVALLYGRTYCIPDDVKMLRHQILRHRIALTYAAVADKVNVETVIDAIVGAVKTP